MSAITPELYSRLHTLEESLLRPSTRGDVKALKTLLAEDFREIASSGRTYDRNQIIDALTTTSANEQIAMSDFRVAALTIDLHGNPVAMTTCITLGISPSGEQSRRARRTSFWIYCNEMWRMRFHQETPLD